MPVGTTIAVTGAEGFVGKNLILRLRELARFQVRALTRSSSPDDWRDAVASADAIIHLAGVNRPANDADFAGNVDATSCLVSALGQAGRSTPIICASSTKAAEDTPYGRSKKMAEDQLLAYAANTGGSAAIFRLPNIFGKWCRPNYNSAVATFSHNVARGLPIIVRDPDAPLSLVYIDDLIDAFVAAIDAGSIATGYQEAGPVYRTSVGAVADLIRRFHDDRAEARVENVGTGLTRALYATYISYLPPQDFSYPLISHQDPRGSFSEMLKTRDAGQFSYFTAHPGVTRGGHYHHTKTEKFLIVHGEALFRFRHMLTGEMHEVRTSANMPIVVETIPGWTHDVTNVGQGPLVSLLWANEIFDRDKPDTIAEKV
jgi:UDP-2-acetamido-2,6-beta-L-arabino-hexul-4-ose reductase